MEKKLNIFDLQGFEDICNEFNITAGSNNHGICQGGYEEKGESNGKLRWNDLNFLCRNNRENSSHPA